MIRLLCAGFALLLAGAAAAADGVARFGPQNAAAELVVWGATDLDELRPLIDRFLAGRPNLAIVYHDMQSGDLYDRVRTGSSPPDLAISSAADLQIKLVNDGFAREHRPGPEQAPRAANSWRNQAFGISSEPAVMVFHASLGAAGPLPRSRAELVQMLSGQADALDGRVATYDLERSGLGYLFASQDALYSSTYTTLMRALGRTRARLYCCSAEMLDKLEDGTVLAAYNVLGSYALARKRRGAAIEIVLPADYTLVLSRVALIPRGAKQPDLGGVFLDFLLSPESQMQFGSLSRYGAGATPIAHPIALNPSLLVYLDPVKRSRFIGAWRSLITAGGG